MIFVYTTDPKTNSTSSKTTTNYDQQRRAIEQLKQDLEKLRQQGIVTDTTISSLGRKKTQLNPLNKLKHCKIG